MDLTSFHMTRRTSEEAIDRSSSCFFHYDGDGLCRNFARCIWLGIYMYSTSARPRLPILAKVSQTKIQCGRACVLLLSSQVYFFLARSFRASG